MRLPVNVRRFRSHGSPRRKLPLVATTNLRIAQIAENADFESVQAFRPGEWSRVEAFRPRVVAGPAPSLRELAERVELNVIDLSSVDHAVFVLTGCGDAPLQDVLRVVLWQTFGVPVYELFVAGRGLVAASECETHEGWHVSPGAAFSIVSGELIFDGFGRKSVRTGLTGWIEQTPCACGREGARLLDVEQHETHPARRLAATA
ncbi:MAG: hypothetical protein JO340_14280 [Acidobacteriaceae bacterium]|nr:hypothetical protein [Acidobacteriaceae bacterium]